MSIRFVLFILISISLSQNTLANNTNQYRCTDLALSIELESEDVALQVLDLCIEHGMIKHFSNNSHYFNSNNGESPLILATKYKMERLANKLLDTGYADVNARTFHEKQRGYDYGFTAYIFDLSYSALDYAASNNMSKLVIRMITSENASIYPVLKEIPTSGSRCEPSKLLYNTMKYEMDEITSIIINMYYNNKKNMGCPGFELLRRTVTSYIETHNIESSMMKTTQALKNIPNQYDSDEWLMMISFSLFFVGIFIIIKYLEF